MSIPAVNVDLVTAHPFNSVVIYVTHLISDEKLFHRYHGAESFGWAFGGALFEGDTRDWMRLLGLESNVGGIVKTPQGDSTIFAANGQYTVTSFVRGEGDRGHILSVM